MDIHPDLAELAFLIGTWSGPGRGSYPTIDDFEYVEEAVFATIPTKPFLVYTQRTRRAGDHPEAGVPLHSEAGYLRPVGPGRVELVIAQPTGIVEVAAGTVSGRAIRLASIRVVTTPTAKRVDSTERNLTVGDDVLDYELLMGAVGEPHQLHLQASLARVR